MTAEAMAMGAVGGALAVFWLVRSFRRAPNPPDPWDAEVSKGDLEACATPVCVNCLTPAGDPTQHYCPTCGNVTGEFTRYIPFVNIRFNYSIFGTLWRDTTGKNRPLARKATALILAIALLACGGCFLLGWMIPG